MTGHGVIGHDAAVRALSRNLPPVLLLTGPPGVGKRAVAEHLIRHHGVLAVDRIELSQPTAAVARQVREQVSVHPCGTLRVVLIELDDCAPAALSALLTVLEQPPAGTRFILLASQAVPDTIRSRAVVWSCGLLTAEESARVLAALGMTPAAACRAARQADGRALPELATEGHSEARRVALELLHAVVTRNLTLLVDSVRAVDLSVLRLLRTALVETVTGRRREFADDELGLPVAAAVWMLAALDRIAGARPALAVRTVLESAMSLPGDSAVAVPRSAS